MAKRYRVTYYQWSFDRYGEKDYEVMDQWVTESVLMDLRIDSSVEELEIHEEEDYTE